MFVMGQLGLEKSVDGQHGVLKVCFATRTLTHVIARVLIIAVREETVAVKKGMVGGAMGALNALKEHVLSLSRVHKRNHNHTRFLLTIGKSM
jgi:hypothetical protein